MEDFKHALETNCLFDLGWQGTKYTWSNGHTDNTFIKLRLDRAVASKEWIEKLGQKKVEVLTSARSNDQPILISLQTNQLAEMRRVRLFRFETKWIKHSEEEKIIKDIWMATNYSENLWKQV